MADMISSFGDVAISSSKGVISILFAGGTAFKIVAFGFLGLLLVGELLPLIQLFCLSVNCFGTRIAACAMNGGFGSGVSVPLLLKIDTLRRAIAFGLGVKAFSSPLNAVPSRDANCASRAMVTTAGTFCYNQTILGAVQEVWR